MSATTGFAEVALLEEAMSTPDGRADPLPLLGHLHDGGLQAVWMPAGYVAVFGYHACDHVMRSPQYGRQPPTTTRSRVVWPVELTPTQQDALRAADAQSLGMWMQLIDPPDHTRIKRLVLQAFTPSRMEHMRGFIERLFSELLDNVEPGTPVEFVSHIARRVPRELVSELIGLPVADREWFAAHAAAQRNDKDPFTGFDGLLAAAQGRRAIADYVSALLDERRASPRDDLVSALIGAEETGGRLTKDELVALTAMLYIASYSTTTDSLSNAVLNLCRHPEQLARLRADPGLVRRANEEALRFTPVLLSLDYWTKSAVEVGGLPVDPGTSLHVFLGAANRDPAVYDRPNDFDVGRQGPPSLSFGAGLHFCLGAALARMIGDISIGALVTRFGSWELADPPPEPAGYFNYRSQRSMHVVFDS